MTTGALEKRGKQTPLCLFEFAVQDGRAKGLLRDVPEILKTGLIQTQRPFFGNLQHIDFWVIEALYSIDVQLCRKFIGMVRTILRVLELS